MTFYLIRIPLVLASCYSFWISFGPTKQAVSTTHQRFNLLHPNPNVITQNQINHNIIHQFMSTTSSDIEIEYTDEEYEELLDEMIYSGDFVGFMRRKAKQIISADFLDFLQEREKSAIDLDDKNVLNEIIGLIQDKLRLSDGMANSEFVFDERLDKILYTAPNKRLQYIEDIKEDMTEGFINHVKKLLNTDKDIDSKVVFASILQLISKVKGIDYVGQEASLLTRADASLGEEFAKDSSSTLITDGDSLATSQQNGRKIDLGDKNEQILAGLLFSKNDILEDVLNNVSITIFV